MSFIHADVMLGMPHKPHLDAPDVKPIGCQLDHFGRMKMVQAAGDEPARDYSQQFFFPLRLT
jgi:hypothetical protein